MSKNLVHRESIENILALPGVQARFNEMLGKRSPQFVSSIITLYKGFSTPVEPRSVVAAAAIAASLDLPIDKNLGMAHIIPYAQVAVFQMGYKAYVQLALRSGQYAGMNAKAINVEALRGYDNIGDPIIDWTALDETKPAVGYAFSWRLVSGFSKTVYWPKTKVMAHAERYSQAFKAKKKDSPWFTAPDQMALKTVIKDALSHWGILSVQMQAAMVVDNSYTKDIGEQPQLLEQDTATEPTAQEPAIETEATVATQPNPPADTKAPEKPDGPAGPGLTPQQELTELVLGAGHTFNQLRQWGIASGNLDDSIPSFDDIPLDVAKRLLKAKVGLLIELEKMAKERSP